MGINTIMKLICAYCHKEKNIVNSNRPDTEGKVCRSCYDKYRRDNIPGAKEKKYACNAKGRAKNPGYNKVYYESHKKKANTYSRKYYLEHKEEAKICGEKYKPIRNARLKIRKTIDPGFLMVNNLRIRLNQFLKGRGKSVSTARDTGCSQGYLKLHLEDLFYPNITTGEVMSWDNYGGGPGKWQIDHMRPFASIQDDPTNRKKLLEIIHYTNLQPLWFEDNIRKNDTHWGEIW